MISVRIATCALLAGATSCVALTGPKTFAEQANAAVDKNGKPAATTGHLDANLSPIDGHLIAHSPRSDIGLTVASIEDGQMCVHNTTSAQHFPSHETVQEDLAQYEEGGSQAVIAFGAHDTLSGLPGNAPWPPRPGKAKYRLVDHKLTKKSHIRESDGSKQTIETLAVVQEWCAAAPKISPSTRYLTATVFKDDTNALFVWVIDGAPAATAGVSGAGPAPDDGAPPEPAEEPEAPVVASAVLDAVAATGKFPTFLKAVEHARVRDAFKDGAEYTLLIPTEETFEKLGKDSVASLTSGGFSNMHPVIWKQHVVVGIRTEKQMVKDYWLEPVGGKHRVEVVKGKTVIGGAHIVGPPIKIPHGVIFPIDKVF